MCDKLRPEKFSSLRDKAVRISVNNDVIAGTEVN